MTTMSPVVAGTPGASAPSHAVVAGTLAARAWQCVLVGGLLLRGQAAAAGAPHPPPPRDCHVVAVMLVGA